MPSTGWHLQGYASTVLLNVKLEWRSQTTAS